MPALKKSLCRQALVQTEQQACNATKIMFETLSNKNEHLFNETVKSLQGCKLNKHHSEMQRSG